MNVSHTVVDDLGVTKLLMSEEESLGLLPLVDHCKNKWQRTYKTTMSKIVVERGACLKGTSILG